MKQRLGRYASSGIADGLIGNISKAANLLLVLVGVNALSHARSKMRQNVVLANHTARKIQNEVIAFAVVCFLQWSKTCTDTWLQPVTCMGGEFHQDNASFSGDFSQFDKVVGLLSIIST